MKEPKTGTVIEAPLPGLAVRGSETGRPIMATLDLLGRRGALRVIWELREGRVLTFRDLQAAAALTPGTLNVRLSELRKAELVIAQGGYSLTQLGTDLLAALWPLTAWSQTWADSLKT